LYPRHGLKDMPLGHLSAHGLKFKDLLTYGISQPP
jgi:hypothetical protein